MLTEIQPELGPIYSPERQARHDQKVASIDNPSEIRRKMDVENRFVNYSRAFRYLNYFAKGIIALLPLTAYINPDYNGVEHLVAGMIATITIPSVIGLGYVVPTKDIRRIENECMRRVSVLEQRIEELER